MLVCSIFCTVQYVQTLGINEQWQFVDVWGFEKELLDMVPQPVCAVLLLYPISDKVYLNSCLLLCTSTDEFA